MNNRINVKYMTVDVVPYDEDPRNSYLDTDDQVDKYIEAKRNDFIEELVKYIGYSGENLFF